jgi:hypothetical protein
MGRILAFNLGGRASESLNGACEGCGRVSVLGSHKDGVIPGNSAEGSGKPGTIKFNRQRICMTARSLENHQSATARDGDQMLPKSRAKGGFAPLNR